VQSGLVHPTTVTSPPGVVPDKGATEQRQDAATATTETKALTTASGITTTVVPKQYQPARVRGVGVGNAAAQTLAHKRKEAKASCAASPPPTSGLLARPSDVLPGRDSRRRSLLLPIVVVTFAAAAIAVAAYVMRRRHTAPGAASRTTTLEVVASVVAITGTLAGIAATYVRGAAVKERPPPAATLVVRDVQARVTYGAYVAALYPHSAAARAPSGATSDSALNRLEIGDVAWLQLNLTGYRHTTMTLRWGLFHAGGGGALIRRTTKEVRMPIDDRSDVHTQFVPVWLGTPRLARFQAAFWLLDKGQVRQMASTESMRGIAYRYACPSR
jgi:hypothetical protein